MENMNTNHEQSVKTEGRDIVVQRVFQAPRELVWEAWTNPDHVVQWWGPRGFTTTTSEIDIREGGVWYFTMHGPDGVDYPNKIFFKEMVKQERLVYLSSDGTEDDPGKFQTTVTFEAQGDHTLLTMRMSFESAVIREKVAEEYGAIEGAGQTLDRLEKQLAAMR